MSLRSWVDKAKGWLGSTPPKPALSEQAVRQTLYDETLFAKMREQAPPLDDLIHSLSRDYGYTDALVGDTFAQLYQSAPILRSRQEMAEPLLLNHAVATSLSRAPEMEQLRPYSRHNKYGAAMATVGVSEKVRQYLAENKELQEAVEAAEQARAEAEQQDQQVSQAAQQGEAAQQALDDAEAAEAAAMGDFDGNGPLTEGQAAARDAAGTAQASAEAAAAQLEALLQQAEAARERAAAAGERVQQEAAIAERATRGPVAEAVKQAAEDLAEEEAMFRAWGFGPGELERMDFEERVAKARRMRNSESKNWFRQLGRWKTMQKAQYAKKVADARDEVYDVTTTGHLPDVMPAEFAHLATEPGKIQFMVRLSERQLLGLKYRGTEKIGQGAICLLVDTSGSMKKADVRGETREVFAKGMALAMLDQARAEGRDFVGIIFANADNQRVWHFPKGQGSFEDVMDFAELFFGGGTDFQIPVDLATDILAKQLSEEGKAQGDLVILTDDDCAVSPEWLAEYQAKKNRLGFRTFGVAVGTTKPGGTLTQLSDDVRGVTEFFDPLVVADIVRSI